VTYTARDTVLFVSYTPKFWFQKSVDASYDVIFSVTLHYIT